MHKYRFTPNKNMRRKPHQKTLRNYELLNAIRSVEVIKKDRVEEIEEQAPTGGFDLFGLTPQVVENVSHKGYTLPTPIQQQTIPAIVAGRDVIGIANTGTGKTAAFLIPLVDKVFRNKSEKALIVAPTRELALQIFEELKSFSKGLGIHAALLIGGMSTERQKNELKQNPHFVIGTPGRMKDLIGERSLYLSQF